MLLVIVGLSGVLLSFLLYHALRERERQFAAEKLRLNADKRIDALQHGIRGQIGLTHTLAAFYASSVEVTRSEFHTYTGQMLTDSRQVKLLAWIRAVPDERRAIHEETVRAEGGEGYEIRQRDAAGNVVRAGRRSVYYPIVYCEPKEAAAALVGLDVREYPELWSAMQRASESRRLVAEAAPPLVPGDTARCSLFAASPIYRPALPPELVEQRPEDLDGFILGSFDIGEIVRAAFTYIEPAALDTSLYAVRPDGKPELLCRQASRLRGRSGDKSEADTPSAEEVAMSPHTDFSAGQGRWRVVCTPIAGYLRREQSWVPLASLLAGLLLTAVVTAYVGLLLQRTAESEEIASRRTLELQTISDAALDAVIMMDHEGRVAHWNPAAEHIFGYAREEIIGHSIHETLAPDEFRAKAVSGIREFLSTGSGAMVGRVLELRAIHRNGTEFPVEMSISPIRQGSHWWAVAIIRDITRRKRIEEAIYKEQRALRQMLNMQERDRKLMAYEIHDGLAQHLAGALLQAQVLPQHLPEQSAQARTSVEQLNKSLGDALVETRRLIAGLRPPVLDEAGVVAGIEFLAAQGGENGAHIDFDHDVKADRFAPTMEVAVFRIVQEALTNARRYSRSKRIEVRLQENGGRLNIDVRDFGVGFDPTEVEPGHYGLQGIVERARILGGQAEISSAPGEGTHIHVELPLVGINGA